MTNNVNAIFVNASVYPECVPWDQPIFKEVEVNGLLTPKQALDLENVVEPFKVPINSKIQVIHRSLFYDPKRLEVAIGVGDWFWQWEAIPDHVGTMVGYTSPWIAALEGLVAEARWKAKMQEQGMTAEQWGAWHPGKAWKQTDEEQR